MFSTAPRRTAFALAAAALFVQLGCTDEPTRPEAGLLTAAGGPLALKGPGQPGSPPLLVWTPAGPYDVFEFESVSAGQKVNGEFTLTNMGGSASGALTISWAGAASFRVTRDDCGRASLPPGRSCTVSVEFEPQVIGHEQSALIASGQRREARARLELHGVGLEPRLQGSEYVEIWGNGTNGTPYRMRPCEQFGDVCVAFFPWRELAGLTSEEIPAYACWGDSSGGAYLKNEIYAPGALVPRGVAFQGDWIGVRIPYSRNEYRGGFHTAVGTQRYGSSATNWNTAARSYRILLICTQSRSESYTGDPDQPL